MPGVNIIEARAGKADRILSRLAQTLSVETGWTISTHLDQKALVNIFLPYLDMPPIGCPTHSVSWFTHYDRGFMEKMKRWDESARLSTVRSTCADIYMRMLEPYGPTLKTIPPLDLVDFSPKSNERSNEHVLIGVSGFVYAQGRKGEALLSALVRRTEQHRGWSFVSSGVGWPIKCLGLPWCEIPNYYRNLSVLLCTSTIEGIPMPPLEALACGIPVIVPQHVGIMDEIIGKPGVYSYEVGNLEQLEEACSQALQCTESPATLHDVVTRFTPKAWADVFVDAVALCMDKDTSHRKYRKLVAGDRGLESASYTSDGKYTDRGVYLVAFGEPSRKCARKCIDAIAKTMPRLPIAFVGSSPLGRKEDIFIEQPDTDIGGRWAKLKVDELAPKGWKYVLYLDADVEPLQSMELFFWFLEVGWEFIICKDMDRFCVAAQMIRPDNKEEARATWSEIGSDQLMQYNGGVFAFRRGEHTAEFFRKWLTEYDRWGKRDQGALLRALHSIPLRLFILTNVWNCSDRYAHAGETAVLHHNIQARRWKGLIDGRLDSKKAWEAVAKWDGGHDP